MTKAKTIRPILFAATAAAIVASVPASAQGLFSSDREQIVMIGGGAQVGPAYPGARQRIVTPLFVLRVRGVGDPLPVRTPEQNPGFPLIGSNNEGFTLGPVVGFQTARRNSDVPVPIGRVGFTVEPGAYVQAYATPWLRLRAEARHGVGGHKAFVGDLEAVYILRGRDDRFVATIGPRLRLGDDRYARAYFGVPADRSVPTGLPAFDPQGGATSAALSAGLLYQFTDRWGAYGFAGYDRLLGDATDSPLVRRYGRRGNVSGGLAVTYSFRRGGQK